MVVQKNQILKELPPRPPKRRPPLLNTEGSFFVRVLSRISRAMFFLSVPVCYFFPIYYTVHGGTSNAD